MNTTTKKPKHYVNNADFLKALVDYRDACVEAKKSNKEDHKFQITLESVFIRLLTTYHANLTSYHILSEMKWSQTVLKTA